MASDTDRTGLDTWESPLPSLFWRINDVDQHSAIRLFQRRTLAASEVLCKEGTPADTLIVVENGLIEVTVGGSHIADVGPESLVGETALFEDAVRGATLRARSDASVLLLSRAGYETLRDTAHPIVRNIEIAAIRHQVRHLRETGTRVAKCARGTPLEPVPLTERLLAAVHGLFGTGRQALSRNPSETSRALSQSMLFADTPDPLIDTLAGKFRQETHTRGALLCSQGTMGDKMFIIESGEVDVIVVMENGQLQRVAHLGPGSAFGMIALVLSGPRIGTVVATTNVVTQTLDRSGWNILVNEAWGAGSAFRRAVIRAFSRQLEETNRQLLRCAAAEEATAELKALCDVSASWTA